MREYGDESERDTLGGRTGRLLRSMAWRTLLLWLLFGLATLGLAYSVVEYFQIQHDNQAISRLAQGFDDEVDEDARPEVRLARLNFLVFRDRLDDALPLAEALSQWDGVSRRVVATDGTIGAPAYPLAVQALYNMGNGRLRHALELLERSRLDQAPQSIRLAQDYYTRALRKAPDHWEARYNLDIASRLIRNLPRQPVSDDDEESPELPKDLWTQLPGLPRGIP